MNKYSSIQEIISEFKLASPPDNFDELKEELKKLRSDNQPHNITGETTPEEIKSHFLRIGEAIDFIDKKQSDLKAVVRVSNLPAIFEAVSKSIRPYQEKAIRESFIKQSETSYKTNFSLHVHSSYRIPRVSFRVITMVTGYIFTFPNTIKDHAVLGFLINQPVFTQIWGIAFLFSCFMLFFIWASERREKAVAEALISDDAIHDFYDHLHKSEFKGSRKFTKHQLIRLITDFPPIRTSFPLPLRVTTRLPSELVAPSGRNNSL